MGFFFFPISFTAYGNRRNDAVDDKLYNSRSNYDTVLEREFEEISGKQQKRVIFEDLMREKEVRGAM